MHLTVVGSMHIRRVSRTAKQSIYAIMTIAAFSWRSASSQALMAGSLMATSSSYRSSAWCISSTDRSWPHFRSTKPSRLDLVCQQRTHEYSTSRPCQVHGDSSEEARTAINSGEESIAEAAFTESPTLNGAARFTRSFRASLSRVFSAAGFVSSSATSLLTDRDQLQRLKETVEAFRNFMKSSGIDLELFQTLNVRLLDNVIILGRVQKAAVMGTDLRDAVRANDDSFPFTNQEEWYKYMRFATAVYGPAMIRAAEMDVTGKFDPRLVSKSVIKTRMSQHVGIPEQDMAVMDVDYDGNSMHLRYFVAVDHVDKKVILAIRGTFSLSEIVTDVAAFSRPFCGGEAHSEMATVAERTWQVVGPTILELLEQNPNYELILTGHSLGAGCAALLNIMCHQDNKKLVRGRSLRCFAYACPPVFAPLENAQDATDACVGFINEMDVVPFLSVDSVRHVFASIRAIEELNLSWPERVKLVTGLDEPDEILSEAVDRANKQRLTPKHGAPVLCIPARTTIWLKEKGRSGTFDAKYCDPAKISRTPIQIDVNMLQDHFASRYEHVLHHLEANEETNDRQNRTI